MTELGIGENILEWIETNSFCVDSDEIKIEIFENQLDENTNFVGYVSHQRAIKYQQKEKLIQSLYSEWEELLEKMS